MNAAPKIRIDYPDQDIQFRVTKFLGSRHFPSFRELDVQVENGTVTLSGELATFYEKQVALNSCQHVAGVLSLIDEVHVEERARGTIYST